MRLPARRCADGGHEHAAGRRYLRAGLVHRPMGWENVKKALLAFWWAFLPTSTDWFSVSYLGIDTPSLTQYLPWLAAGLCGLWLLAMRRAPTVAFSFVFAALLMGFFQQSKYPGGLRHVGNVFLFLLTCAWLARREVVATR